MAGAIIVAMESEEAGRRQRVRVKRGSRWWRWKLTAVVLGFCFLLLCCYKLVPQWLGAVASDAGTPGESSSEAPPHP